MREGDTVDLYNSAYLMLKRKLFHVAEAGEDLYMNERIVPIPERLVRCIWYDQRLNKKKLSTVDGTPVFVYSQGEWNLGSGPDFTDALVQIGNGDTIKGPVEIHVRTSDWRRHGHQKNSDYRGVLLNVSMWHDDGVPTAFNDLNEPIPHVELYPATEEELFDIAADIDMENYPFSGDGGKGRCSESLGGREERLRHILEIAGEERLLSKARRFWRHLQKHTFAETLFHAVMESMGYRPNKAAFRKLAEKAPASAIAAVCADIDDPQLRAEALQSLLFGASGLFSNVAVDLWDIETRDYCERLAAQWEKYGPLTTGPPMHKNDWTLRGVRPANFPLRRMAGIALLLARLGPGGLERALADFSRGLSTSRNAVGARQQLDALCEKLVQPPGGYWSNRITPAGNTLDKTPALIGPSLVMAIAVNIFLPMLLCRARREDDAGLTRATLAFYRNAPRLEMHQITRLMRYRIWGDLNGGAALLKKEIYQQGLLQIFFDFCDENVRDCKNCMLPRLLREGPELPLHAE